MRAAADPEGIRRLARELGRVVAPGTRMYLTGGATAVLEGWRPSTVDVDVRFEPDSDAALARIAALKEELSLNVELASPLDFLPPLANWRERSRFRFREGDLRFSTSTPTRRRSPSSSAASSSTSPTSPPWSTPGKLSQRGSGSSTRGSRESSSAFRRSTRRACGRRSSRSADRRRPAAGLPAWTRECR